MRQLKNRLEGLVYNNQRVFDQFREMLDDERRRRIHESLLQARVALSKDDRGELEVAMYDLNTISRMLSDVMLEKTDRA